MPVNDDLAGLLRLLACPACGGDVAHEPARLRCGSCERAFDFHAGVPVLEQRHRAADRPTLLGRLHYAVLGSPRVYELHQRYGGGRPIAAQVERQLGDVERSTVLDIGAGTGMVAGLLPPGARYVWFDNDRLKLRGLLAKSVDCWAVLGDAAHLPFASEVADWTVMVEVSHHLPAEALQACLAEAARVTRERFVFVDALRSSRLRSRLLWQVDLGRFPRGEEELLGALDDAFTIEKVERFRINHDHLVCVCVPRRDSRVSSAR